MTAEAPIDGTPHDLDHALELHALHMEASISLLRTMIEGAEATIPTLPRLGQVRRRAALGRLRHVLGIEFRPDLTQAVALARSVPVVDIGQRPGALGWLLLIVDGSKTHAHPLSGDDMEQLRALAAGDFAVAELRIWIEGTHEVDSMARAAALSTEVVAVALLEGLRNG